MTENTPKLNANNNLPKYMNGVLKEKSNISTVTTNQPSKSSTVSQNKMTPKAINKTKPTLGSAAISSELKARLGSNHVSHLASHTNSVTPIRNNRPTVSTNSIGSHKKENSEKKKTLTSLISSCNQSKAAAGLSTPLNKTSSITKSAISNKPDISEYYSNPFWKSEYASVAARKAELGYAGPGFIVQFDCNPIHLKNLYVKKGLWKVISKDHACLTTLNLGPMLFQERIDAPENKTPSKAVQHLDFEWTPKHSFFDLIKSDQKNDTQSLSMASCLNLETKTSILHNNNNNSSILHSTLNNSNLNPKKKVRFQDLQKIDEAITHPTYLSPVPDKDESYTISTNKSIENNSGNSCDNYIDSPTINVGINVTKKGMRRSYSASDVSKLIFSHDEPSNDDDIEVSNLIEPSGKHQSNNLTVPSNFLNSTYDKVSNFDYGINISLQISPMNKDAFTNQQTIRVEQSEQITCKLTFDEVKCNDAIPTISLALPVSSILNEEQDIIYLANEIAIFSVTYCVNEIIIYNDSDIYIENEKIEKFKKILEYLECPPCLRKFLYSKREDYLDDQKLTPINSLHHFDVNENWSYRDGVVTEATDDDGSWIDFGFNTKIKIDEKLELGTRVTVKLDPKSTINNVKIKLVSHDIPFKENGLYWGYKLRHVNSLNNMINDSDVYDYKIAIEHKNNIFTDIKLNNNANKILLAIINTSNTELKDIFNHVCSTSVPNFYGRKSMRLQDLVSASLLNLKFKLGKI